MAEDKRLLSWQVPKFGSASKKEVVEWCRQQVKDGKEFQEASPGFQQLQEAIRILSGQPTSSLKDKQDKDEYSKLVVNHLKRTLRENVNSLSEIRYNPGYFSRKNETKKAAELLNNVGNSWYVDQFVDLKIKKSVQWMAICPCGWLEICFRRLPGEHGRADIDAVPWSWFDVVMTGVPESGDHQEAYTVSIIKDLPMYQAHSTFHEFQSKLVPNKESPKGLLDKVKEKAAKVIRDVWSSEPEKVTAKNPVCTIYYQYILDLSINQSGKTLKMGYAKVKFKGEDGKVTEVEQETPWSYEVPSLGMPVARGKHKVDGVEPPQTVYSPATAEECRIFPGRRLVIFAESIEDEPLYDGPMHDWHGKVPLVKFCADSWPFGEFSMLYDAAPIHEAVNEIYRISHMTVRNRFNPSFLYNIKAMDKDKAKTIRADVQGERIGFNGDSVRSAREAINTLFDQSFNTIEEWITKLREDLVKEEDFVIGRPNFQALAKMKMQGSLDEAGQALQEAGPIVKGISRDMERSMRDFADMFKYLVFQYKTVPELMWMVSEDEMTPASFDYDPGNLIPSHMPGEDPSLGKSVFSKMQRARYLSEHIKFMIMPGTMHEIVQTQQKLLYMQLWAKGYPIDPVTLGEVLRLGNVGTIEGSTMIERYFNWKKKEMEMMVAIRLEMQQLMGEEAGGGEMPGNASKLGPGGGQKGKGGRAGTMAAPPKLQQKGDGRVITRESQ